jgi:hypothetical protein
MNIFEIIQLMINYYTFPAQDLEESSQVQQELVPDDDDGYEDPRFDKQLKINYL